PHRVRRLGTRASPRGRAEAEARPADQRVLRPTQPAGRRADPAAPQALLLGAGATLHREEIPGSRLTARHRLPPDRPAARWPNDPPVIGRFDRLRAARVTTSTWLRRCRRWRRGPGR